MTRAPLSKVKICGKLVSPLVEGGKGLNITNGYSSGAWAKCGGVGTFSGMLPNFYDENGDLLPYTYSGVDRGTRHNEIVVQNIRGCIAQARLAHDLAMGNGAVLMNVLWEAGGVPEILAGALPEVSGILDGVVCGAGLPFQLSEIAALNKVYYVPIVSSELAFRILWQRSFYKNPDWIGGVVYEDPWLAGGHNGISSREDPVKPEKPKERLLKLRHRMNEVGLNEVTLIIAGGVWNLAEWYDYFDSELEPVAFQFGTRPLLTKESPISDEWKDRLFDLEPGIVKLHKFSPTGFYSSSIKNNFLTELYAQLDREVPFSLERTEEFTEPFQYGRRQVYLKSIDSEKVVRFKADGYTDPLKTPDGSFIFLTPERRKQITQDQIDCIGCLNSCRFSNWDQHKGSTGRIPDPRSFCISKTLMDIGHGGSVDNNLWFSGTNVYRFKTDPFYANRRIPTVAELFNRINEEYVDGVSEILQY